MKNSILFMLGISLFSMTACSDGDKRSKTTVSSSTVISVTKESSGNTKKNESNSITKTSNVITSSTSVEKPQVEVSLADFIGGWGIPQSGNLFLLMKTGHIQMVK